MKKNEKKDGKRMDVRERGMREIKREKIVGKNGASRENGKKIVWTSNSFGNSKFWIFSNLPNSLVRIPLVDNLSKSLAIFEI